MLVLPLSEKQILQFLEEDVGTGDVTTNSIPKLSSNVCKFQFLSKNQASFVLCGAESLGKILNVVAKNRFNIEAILKDGDTVLNDDIILQGMAFASDLLIAERVALNIMQHLSGIATNAAKFIEKLGNNKIKILDTRKTIPGIRMMQKYATACGGVQNHRFGLYDMIMIKDNHIAAAGGIKNAIRAVNKASKGSFRIEVECETVSQVKEAILETVDVIMLDNMSISEIRKSSKMIRSFGKESNKDIKIEVSGGITSDNISKYRNLDIDYISVGSITHSVQAVDISMKIRLS